MEQQRQRSQRGTPIRVVPNGMAAPRAMAASRTPPTNEEAKEEEQKQQERASALPNDDELVLNTVSAPTIPM